MALRLVLPYPPSANRYWRHVGRNIVVSAEARQYRQGVKMRALAAGIRPEHKLSGPVVVSLALYRPAKRGDLDNSLKVLFDSMNGILWEDDGQVAELHAIRLEDKANPRVEITAAEQ